MNEYQILIIELKRIKSIIDKFLEVGNRNLHKNMKCVSSGVWINEKYDSLSECISDLRSLIPPY